MPNITENRVNTVLTAADLAAITTNANAIAAKLPAITLTDDERKTYLGMDVDNKVFVEDCIDVINTSGAGILPVFITSAMIQSDLTLFEQMDSILTQLYDLVQKAEDIKRAAGSEAYGTSTAAYNVFEIAAKVGLPNAQSGYDKMSARYQVSSRTSKKDTTP